MVKVLGISKSGYYRSREGKESNRKQEERELAKEILEIHEANRRIYGSPKIHEELKKEGKKISRQRVKKIMKANDIGRKNKRKFVKTTDSNHKEYWSPNLLVRDFSAPQSNAVWVSDITYIPTDEGWMYLCVILDLFSRIVAGWALRPYIKDDLVIEALDDAYKRRRPPRMLIFHSDGGRQYVSKDFRERLDRYGMIQSMSGKGDPWDNAVAESFFSQFKKEQIHPYRFAKKEHLQDVVFSYIEMFYNRRRTQKRLGYVSPTVFEFMRAVAKVA